MKPFQIHEGKAAVMDRDNVDTDQIIPKQFLKRIEKTGYGRFAFYDWRFGPNNEPNPDFELNQEAYKGASILLAGENFGCGSSREHAPWALSDYGFRVIIAASFADIFYQNCLKNGMLPIQVTRERLHYLMKESEGKEKFLTVNLVDQTIWDAGGLISSFEIDPHWKDMLLNGRDEIAYTLLFEECITAYEGKRKAWA
ncbi:3-isopropylmalate dehydratase small subunit [Metabacillus sp. GX 13764]|uniref:3-isopropylmalate dehydratase small subunit n=1 Tax=Metabacillus kandeliae TaxID=2900151 RepID=UPI001E5B3AB6|nr:3-isopropylmalate dehydratase small subunit [Metabacillus kandeliae]MCD7032880.1 3-isopropylmalate dehydratase small subunit [Metabacillus kandeliae]